MRDLFAYGTLMCADIMRAVSGCSMVAGIPTVLRDHCRLYVRGERYPGLLARPGASIAGIAYRNLPAAAWARLDRFEGEMYLRRTVEVEIGENRFHRVQTYLFRPELAARLEDRVWELEDFLRHGKADFESAYRGYAALVECSAARGEIEW